MDAKENRLGIAPDILEAKADEMNDQKTVILQIIDQAKSAILSLDGEWKGAAADEFFNRFSLVCDDVDNILADISDHIHEIKGAAQIYRQTESSVKSATEGLPVDERMR